MRLIDRLLDGIIDTPLFEMAHSRADVKRKALSHVDTLVEHLVKLLIWPHNPAANVWGKTVRKTVINTRKTKQVGTKEPLDIGTLRMLWVTGPIGDNPEELLACVKDTIEAILADSNLVVPDDLDYAAIGGKLKAALEKAVADVHKKPEVPDGQQ